MLDILRVRLEGLTALMVCCSMLRNLIEKSFATRVFLHGFYIVLRVNLYLIIQNKTPTW